jgi:TrmH family RNA methyltransferase
MISKALVKYVQSLHQKKYRQRHGAFLVEGGKSVLELLSSGIATEHVLLTPEFADQNRARLPTHHAYTLATEAELTQLGTLATNTTALAVARLPTEPALPAALPATRLLLALDEVRDPGNLGTLIRLADWYGLPGVVLSETCADPYAPKTVAATMGSFARVQVWQRELPAWLAALPPAVGIFGADLHGDNVHQLTLQPAGVLVMGSESHGLTPAVEACLTRRLHIPRGAGGGAESLNVAISAAILLDNFFRGQ